MRLKPKFFKQNRPPPSQSDSGGEGQDLQRSNTSYWTGVYNTNVKTDSFNDFLMELRKVTDSDGNEGISKSSSFPSLRPLVERLIKPDQATVEEVLQGSNRKEESEVLDLATDYFDSSQDAYRLCVTLIRSVKEARDSCKGMGEALASLPQSGELGDGNHLQVMERMHDLAESGNPFSDPAAQLFPAVEASYGVLSSKVEEERIAIGKRIRVVKRWRNGTVAIAVGVVGVSVIAVVVAMHAVAGLAAAPVVMAAGGRRKGAEGCCKKLRMGVLRRQGAQLEAVARGTFTVKRMLETIFCFVARLYEDVEDNRRKVRFGWSHKEETLSVQQVAETLEKSLERLSQRLEELEEHVVCCCLMINRARAQIMHEFLAPTKMQCPQQCTALPNSSQEKDGTSKV